MVIAGVPGVTRGSSTSRTHWNTRLGWEITVNLNSPRVAADVVRAGNLPTVTIVFGNPSESVSCVKRYVEWGKYRH